MYSFLNDYSEGAHPEVLDALLKTNDIQTVGYGLDEYCFKAKDVIIDKMKRDADIHFLVGGTQTNLLFITSVLKSYQAVIACDEGHINVHETGAVEATGHKVLVKPHQDGKVTIDMVEDILKKHRDEHMVQPRMVYISQTTELGTYYTKEELKTLYHFVHSHGLYLFLDGARLGSALVLEDAPSLEDIACYTDAFYIGGTKMGALFGEALVILNDDLKEDFRYHIKQRGAMLAKGRLLGVQFYTLFKDDLYERIGRHENDMAMQMKNALVENGFEVYLPSSTNQIFVDVGKEDLEKIEEQFMVTHIEDLDHQKVRIRLVTSWATPQKAVDDFVKLICEL